MSVRCPPNLSYEDFPRLLDAGINDWGGVSPVTVDHVLRGTVAGDRVPRPLHARVASKPRPASPSTPSTWRSASAGSIRPWARTCCVGPTVTGSAATPAGWRENPRTRRAWRRSARPKDPPRQRPCWRRWPRAWISARTTLPSCSRLAAGPHPRLRRCGRLAARGLRRRCQLHRHAGINYTNVCYFRCGFCAFSKGKLAENLRGAPISCRLKSCAAAARRWDRGAVEVCLQGGIHPAFTGDFYLDVCKAIKSELPDLHLRLLGARGLAGRRDCPPGIPLASSAGQLRDAGLASLPNTTAEILDDEIRRLICPDKISAEQWLEVHGLAHEAGLHSTTTVMYGHTEGRATGRAT
ncbi:MAG: radical SAM protein [Solirubrobacterales bacterium]